MSLGKIHLQPIGTTIPERLPDGRTRFARVFSVDPRWLESDVYTTEVLSELGTADGAGAFNPGTEKVFSDHVLVSVGVLSTNSEGFRQLENGRELLRCVYELAPDELTAYAEDQFITGPDGLREIVRTLVQKRSEAFTHGNVGTDTYGGGILREERVEVGKAIRTVVRTYKVSGVLRERKRNELNGLQYFTRWSVGTKDVPTGTVLEEDEDNVGGLTVYRVMVVRKQNGTALSDGDELRSWLEYVDFPCPGLASISSSGLDLNPPTTQRVAATVTLTYQTSSVVSETVYQVKRWAKFNLELTPSATGVPQVQSKGLRGYLGSSTVSVTNGTYQGVDVDSAQGSIASDPASPPYGDTIYVDAEARPEFVAENGTVGYVKRTVQLTVPTPS